MQSLLISSLSYFLQLCPFYSFQTYAPSLQFLPDSWQIASTHTSHGWLKLRVELHQLTLPPNQQSNLHLCSTFFYFITQVSFLLSKSTSSSSVSNMTLLPLLSNCTPLSLLFLYWSYCWSHKTCSDKSPFIHRSSSCCINSSEILKEIAVHIHCPIFLFYTHCSIHIPINLPKQFFQRLLMTSRLLEKSPKRISCCTWFFQEYLTLLNALSFLKVFLPLALMTPHCPRFPPFFHNHLQSFFCRFVLLYPGIRCWSSSRTDIWLPSHLTLSSFLRQCLPTHSSKNSHYTNGPQSIPLVQVHISNS